MYLKVMLEVINDFATNVKKQRKKLAMSQEELANKADVSIQTISSIENARHFPTYNKLIRLSNALQVHPAQLLIENCEFRNTEDKELHFVLVQAFKDLTPKQREIALHLVRSISEINI